jgi:hypothetical protein
VPLAAASAILAVAKALAEPVAPDVQNTFLAIPLHRQIFAERF